MLTNVHKYAHPFVQKNCAKLVSVVLHCKASVAPTNQATCISGQLHQHTSGKTIPSCSLEGICMGRAHGWGSPRREEQHGSPTSVRCMRNQPQHCPLDNVASSDNASRETF